jgi:hypothetical protein
MRGSLATPSVHLAGTLTRTVFVPSVFCCVFFLLFRCFFVLHLRLSPQVYALRGDLCGLCIVHPLPYTVRHLYFAAKS